jgi:hypothetical protein
MQLGWSVPVEAEPYADLDDPRGRCRSLIPVCAFWIELARGLLSARRWPVGTLVSVTRAGRAVEGEV